ncbi:MAG TPA: hypothetical protein VGQ96_05640 [Candidatus Eremiobacteraceae bacterium]|nr:hypothetical protein [Candidatus Eremiobacteraceae bacterium]
MTKRTRRDDGKKKAKRFASLRERRAKKSALYAALEHRQHEDSIRLAAARRRCVKTTGHPKTQTIEQRRREYIEIPSIAAPPIPPRSIAAAVGLAFALPLIVALAANIMPGPQVGAVASHPIHNLAARPFTKATTAAERVRAHQGVATLAPTGPRQPSHRAAPPSSRPTSAAQTAVAQTAIAIAPKQSAAATLQPSVVPPMVAVQAPAAEPTVRHIALAPSTIAPPRHHTPTSQWSLSPDGTWTALVHAPSGMRNVSFTASTGQIIALERSAVDSDAATVTIGWSRPVAVSISSDAGSATKTLPAPDDGPAAFAATARAVGPHLVNVGWTPLAQNADVVDYKVYRSAGDGVEAQLVAQVAAIKHSWRDLAAAASSSYRYDVVAETATGAIDANTQAVSTPDEMPAAPASVLAGKGMFLYFSSLDDDARSFRHYHPEAVIAEAQKAGIHVIELRMARGSCPMAQTAQSRAWLNRIIDAAARANISLIAWTVPRRVTTQDVAQTIEAAAYKTPAGNGFVGLALDLETGDRYMGDGRKASASLVQYIKAVRSAAGPHYLIVATVASPHMGNHTNEDYPYAKIAAYADVLQPMEYWHYFDETSHHEYARREVTGAAAAAVARTRELAGRDIPVNVAGQSVDLQGTGAPSGREIMWSLNGAKSAGGIGETFFDWAGTRPDAWAAIQAFDW